MLANLLAKRAEKKASSKKKDGKDKKRKSEAAGVEGDDSPALADERPLAKRNKHTPQQGIQMSSKVQQELAALEAKRKSGVVSDAVKSIYGDGRGLRAEKNDFFSRTFNRVSSRGFRAPWITC
jgi:hypothetical protein